MKNKGYEWNVYRNNYVEVVGKVVDELDTAELPQESFAIAKDGIEEYLPFLRFLYEKRDDLYQLLSGTKEYLQKYGFKREIEELLKNL